MALVKCKECGSLVSDRANFCPSCGCPVKKEVKVCPECGSPLSEGAQSCPSCGFPIEPLADIKKEDSQSESRGEGQHGAKTEDAAKNKRLAEKVFVCLVAAAALFLAWKNNPARTMALEDTENQTKSSSAKGSDVPAAYSVNPWTILKDGENVRLVSCKLETAGFINDNRGVNEKVNAVFYVLCDKRSPSGSRFWISIPRVESAQVSMMWDASCYRAEYYDKKFISPERNILNAVLAQTDEYGILAYHDDTSTAIIRSVKSGGMIMTLCSSVTGEYVVILYIPAGLADVMP